MATKSDLWCLIRDYLVAKGWEYYPDYDISDTWLLPNIVQLETDDIANVVRWQIDYELSTKDKP